MAPPSDAMNDSPIRPPPPKAGSRKTSTVDGSPSSNAFTSARSSTVPASASTSPKCWSPSSRSTRPRHTGIVGSRLSGPRIGASRRGIAPPLRRTSTSAVPNAPAPIGGFSETHAWNPAFATAAAIARAAASGRMPGVRVAFTSRPSTRTRTVPPPAGSP